MRRQARHTWRQHVKDILTWAPEWVSVKPQIINIDKADLTGWDPMGETDPRG
jgi:hypothetical protein